MPRRASRGRAAIASILLALSPELVGAAEESGRTLRRRANAHDLLIGSAVSLEAWHPVRGEVISPLRDDTRYRRHLRKQFNIVTPENVMKWDHLRPDSETVEFRHADELVEFAEAHGQAVHGHTLVWHNALPDWLENGSWARPELRRLLRRHILTVGRHYAGRVHSWDVVNEAVDDTTGELRRTIWSTLGNPRYIRKAFRWARKAAPDALLCYNDYNHADMEGWQQRKSDAVFELVRDLVRAGVPIDCVGFQFHVDATFRHTAVAENFRRYADLGLQVQVTEMDVRLQEPITQADLNAQAAIYREVLDLCLDAPNCTAFIMWGFTDRYSWVPWFFDGWGGATIMTEGYKKKPAFRALMDALE
jgi:endo-1,4-beta-xylanase